MSVDIFPGAIRTARNASLGNAALGSTAVRPQARATTAYAPSHHHVEARESIAKPGEAKSVAKLLPKPISLSIVSGLLRGVDAVLVLLAGLLALAMAAPDLPMSMPYYVSLSLFGALVALNALSLAGAYDKHMIGQGQVGLARILFAWAGTGAVMALAMAVSGANLADNWIWLGLWFVIGALLPAVMRLALALRMDYWRQAGRLRRRVAVFGMGPSGQAFLRKLVEQASAEAAVVGLYDRHRIPAPEGWHAQAQCGNCDDLIEDIRRHRIDTVVITSAIDAGRRSEALAKLRCVAVDICLWSEAQATGPENQSDAKEKEDLGGVKLRSVERKPYRDWAGVAKTLEDRIFAAVILVLISPILAAIAIAIKLDSPGPVLFRQKRYGRNNQLIEVLKFRSMYQHKTDANAEQLTQRNDPRVTKLGAFLRRTSLDELPQFINVLRGEMSVVGPRPHALRAKAGGILYDDAVQNYHWRHRVKPGITGWAQVNGWRGETETVEQIRKRVEYDIHYIRHWSLLLDVQIILRTIFGGFTGSKAY